MGKFINLSGNTYGRLKVISFAYYKDNNSQWNCICSCGNSSIVKGYNLRNGRVKSCGCYRKENTPRLTHGETNKTKEYIAWAAMIQRAENINHPYYYRYGGRGIKICDRWRYSFENFLADMGRAPSENHSLDRENNDGDYEKSNCRWATKYEQVHNRQPSSEWIRRS